MTRCAGHLVILSVGYFILRFPSGICSGGPGHLLKLMRAEARVAHKAPPRPEPSALVHPDRTHIEYGDVEPKRRRRETAAPKLHTSLDKGEPNPVPSQVRTQRQP